MRNEELGMRNWGMRINSDLSDCLANARQTSKMRTVVEHRNNRSL